MHKTPHPQIVTANDLITGVVVYLTASNQWTRKHSYAELLSNPAHAQSRLDYAQAQQDRVVGAYLTNATEKSDGAAPMHIREKFRALGPSIEFPQKQTEQINVSI